MWSDFPIEEFWYGFKISMKNFYLSTKIPTRNITKWSNILNLCKKIKAYNQIEYNIRNYMSLYALDIMKYEKDSIYNGNILNTNIKRWNLISLNNNFTISEKHNNILLLFDVFCNLKNKINNLSQQIQLAIENSINPSADPATYKYIETHRNLSQQLIELLGYFEDIEILIYFDNYDQL